MNVPSFAVWNHFQSKNVHWVHHGLCDRGGAMQQTTYMYSEEYVRQKNTPKQW